MNKYFETEEYGDYDDFYVPESDDEIGGMRRTGKGHSGQWDKPKTKPPAKDWGQKRREKAEKKWGG